MFIYRIYKASEGEKRLYSFTSKQEGVKRELGEGRGIHKAFIEYLQVLSRPRAVGHVKVAETASLQA